MSENFHLTYAQSPETPERRIQFLRSQLTANFTIRNGYEGVFWEFPTDICTKPRNSREARTSDTISPKSAHGSFYHLKWLSKMAMKVTFENFYLTYAQSPETPERRIQFLKSQLMANFTI